METKAQKIERLFNEMSAEHQRTMMRRMRHIIHVDQTEQAKLAAQMILGNKIKYDDIMSGAADYL